MGSFYPIPKSLLPYIPTRFLSNLSPQCRSMFVESSGHRIPRDTPNDRYHFALQHQFNNTIMNLTDLTPLKFRSLHRGDPSKSILTLLLCCFLASSMLWGQSHAPSRTAPPYTGMKVAVHETGPGFWIYGEGAKGKGFYHDFNGWEFVAWPSNYGEVKSFEANYSKLTVLTTDGKLRYWFSPGHWAEVQGFSKIVDVSNKPNGLYILGTITQANGNSATGIFKGQSGSRYARDWTPVFTGHAASGFKKIDQDQYGNLYMTTGGGQLYLLRKGASQYEIVSGINVGTPIVVHDLWVLKNGVIYGTDAKTKTIHKWNPSSKRWSGLNFKSESWGVTDGGDIYGIVHNRVECIKGGRFSRITIDNPNKMDGAGNTSITRAIRERKSGDIGRYVANGGDVNLPDRNGDSPVIVAAKEGSSSGIRELARYKADLNKKDKAGYTALYHAVKNGKSGAMNALLENGATANSKGVVEAAVDRGDTYYVTQLAKFKADLSPGLPLAAGKSNTSMFQVLLQNGARATDIASFKKATDLGNTEIATLSLDNGTNKDEALKYSLERSNGQMIGLCLQKGAKADPAIDYVINKNDALLAGQLVDNYGIPASTLLTKSLNGSTPSTQIAEVALLRHADPNPFVDKAVQSKNREVYSLLLRHNANPTTALRSSVMTNNTDFARMALDKGGAASDPAFIKKAVDNKNREMASLLLSRGASARDPQLIRSTVTGSDLEMTRLLINNSAPVNDPQLVMIPVKSDNYEMTNLLLSNGASATSPSLMRESIGRENAQITELLIQKGAPTSDVNMLNLAIDKDNFEITDLLVRNGAPAKDPSAIKKSVQKDNFKISELLINHGASATDPQLIDQSVTNNSPKVTGLLLSKGADATKPSLIKKAVSHNNNELSKMLFDKGAPGSDPILMKTAVKNNNTALTSMVLNKGGNAEPADLIQTAVDHKNKGLVEVLVDKGADPTNGVSKAVATNQTDISLYLLDKGATATDPTLMKQSSKNGNLSIVKKLVEKGGEPENGTENAVNHGKHNVLEYLVTEGVEVRKTEYMASAVKQNHVGVFKILNNKEAPVDFVDPKGNNLVHIAAKNQSNEVMSALTFRGVDVNAMNQAGDSPLLIVVAEKNELDAAKILVDAGADVNARNAKGKTVLKVCKGRQVKKYLKTVGASKK